MAGTLCRRYGPGRLPYANRDDVGGGIAMAATGLLAVTLWVGTLATLAVTRGTNPLGGSVEVAFVAAGSILVVPVAVLAAFVVGTLLWRYVVPDGARPLAGAIAGGCTAVASLVLGAVGAGLLFTLLTVADGGVTAPVDLAVLFLFTVVTAGVFAIVFVGWLVLPLGVFGGWYHERAKRRRTDQ